MRLGRRAFLGAALSLMPGLVHAADPPGRDDSYWSPERVSLEGLWYRTRELVGPPAFNVLSPLPPEDRADPLFGINNALIGEDGLAPLMRGSGATLDRIELRWDEIEPRPGELRFDRFDRLLGIAERWGLRVLPVVIGAPAWAVDRPERVGAGPPRDLVDWERFLRAVRTRYRGRFAGWEIWNEPNIPEFWRGTVADYAHLLRVAHRVLAGDAPVLVGGMVQDDGGFLRALIRLETPFDAVGWHVYNDPAELNRLTALTRSLTRKPVWITEANVPVADHDVLRNLRFGDDAVSTLEQAAFVLRLYALARAAGVANVALYRAADVDYHLWGLVRQDMSVRPALLAYRAAARWLGGTTTGEITYPAPGVTQVALRRPGQLVRVLWNDSSAEVSLPVPKGLLVYTSGASVNVSAGKLALPPAPRAAPAAVTLGSPRIVVTPEP